MTGRGAVRWRQIHFALPLEAEVAVTLLHRLVADASLGRIVLEARARVGRVAYLVGAASGQRLDDIVRQLAPGSRVVPLAEDRQAVEQALSVSARRARLPLSGERLEAVARAVLAALAGTGSQEELVIQLQIGRRSRPSLWSGQQPQGWLELLGFASPPAPGSELVGQQRAQAAQHRAGVVLRLGVRASTPMRRRQLLESLLGALRLAESAGLAFRARSEAAWRLNHGQRPWRYPLTLTAHDLACVSGWPIGLGQLPAMPSRHPRFLPVPVWRDQQRVFARGVADQQDQRLGLSIRDALHHTVLLGPTGVGKSTAMLHLALADIRAGRSVLVIDPKAGLVDDLLARIPAERADDVVVIDPSDARPVGLNPVACPPGPRQAPEVVADAILAVFKQLFAESWGVRSEEILTASLLTLARTPGATLVDLPLLLTNPAIRRSIVGQHTDPLGTDQFWDTYEALSEGQRSQWIAPVLNKLQPFLIRTWLRTMLGQAEPSFDLSQLFTQRRIVLVALNKGLLGAEAARLLGSLIVGQLWPRILARAASRQAALPIVSVYIDEVQDYLALPGDLADALAQARSLGVAFHLAHQYRAQLPPGLRAGIDSNARNKIIFGLSASDAAELARQAPELESDDFQLLPRFQIYTRTLHQGQPQPWALARTLPPPPACSDPAQLRLRSSQRYGQDGAATEQQLRARLDGTSRSGRTTVTGEAVIGRRNRQPEQSDETGRTSRS